MAQEAYLNDTVRILVTFRDFDGALDDPTEIFLYIYEGFTSPVAESTPITSWPSDPVIVRISEGRFYYDWTPTATGTFVVRYYAIFGDSGATPPSDIVDHEFTVLDSQASSVDEALGIDYEFTFAGVLSPLYVNPDELIAVFPDATEIEIAEALWLTSMEVKEILKLRDDEVPTYAALEYVKVAAACNLSRIHASTMGDESTFRLGDLSVTSRAVSKGAITRANATTWCELAGVLRKEMLASGSRMRAVVRGSDYPNPIPTRKYGNYNAGTRFISTLENPPRQGELDTFGPA
jgi:hypothetical protein